MRRVSVLLGLAEQDPEASARVKAFRLGMRDLEWIEGRNVQIEYRFAGSNLDLINKHVAELIKSAPDVIVANSTPVMAALKPATSTIPIVFVVVNDPLGQGFISNLKQPGGNITGYSFIEPELIGKWINLLSDVKPGLSRVTLMFNPNTAPYYDRFIQSYKASTARSSVDISAAHVQSTADVNLVVAELAHVPGGGLITPGDPYILTSRGAILLAARQHGLPMISPYRQFVAEGSLMSYGPDTADIFRRSSSYVDRVLRGESVGKLPAQSPDKFELVINLKSAKALGLSVRESFLLLADEVIE
jgi:putative tryptophan/tyrosine transport system substrate-binding protein